MNDKLREIRDRSETVREKQYNESFRVYHNFKHTIDVRNNILRALSYSVDDPNSTSAEMRPQTFVSNADLEKLRIDEPITYNDVVNAMLIAADFHDIVYTAGDKRIPYGYDKKLSDEEMSVKMFMDYANSAHLCATLSDFICALIMSTAAPENYRFENIYISGTRTDSNKTYRDCYFKFCRLFTIADWPNFDVRLAVDPSYTDEWLKKPLTNIMIEKLKKWETGIFKEFQNVSLVDYINGRTKFLKDARDHRLLTEDEYTFAYNNVKNRQYSIGVYAGTFEPFHIGHEYVLEQAQLLFDKVIVARGHNGEKPKASTNLQDTFVHEEAVEFDGYLADYLVSQMTENVQVTLIRGVRSGYDLEYELNVINATRALIEQRFGKKLNVILIPCTNELNFVSGKFVRGLLNEADKILYKPRHNH